MHVHTKHSLCQSHTLTHRQIHKDTLPHTHTHTPADNHRDQCVRPSVSTSEGESAVTVHRSVMDTGSSKRHTGNAHSAPLLFLLLLLLPPVSLRCSGNHSPEHA